MTKIYIFSSSNFFIKRKRKKIKFVLDTRYRWMLLILILCTSIYNEPFKILLIFFTSVHYTYSSLFTSPLTTICERLKLGQILISDIVCICNSLICKFKENIAAYLSNICCKLLIDHVSRSLHITYFSCHLAFLSGISKKNLNNSGIDNIQKSYVHEVYLKICRIYLFKEGSSASKQWWIFCTANVHKCLEMALLSFPDFHSNMPFFLDNCLESRFSLA